MRLPKNLQAIIFSSLAAAAAALFVSDSRIKRDPKKLLEKAVGETVAKWKDRLSLSTEQVELLRKKLMASGYRKTEVVQSNLQRAEKDRRITELNDRENEELREIFTEPQYDLYTYILQEEDNRRI